MGTLASLILNQAILGPLTPPCSVTNHTGSMVLALQDVPGPQQPFWLFTRGPIFKYCPVVLTRKQSLYSCHRLPRAVLKTSGIQSYHMEEPGLLPVAQTDPEGTQWEKWERDFLFLSPCHHLRLVYHLSLFTPARIPWVSPLLQSQNRYPNLPFSQTPQIGRLMHTVHLQVWSTGVL